MHSLRVAGNSPSNRMPAADQHESGKTAFLLSSPPENQTIKYANAQKEEAVYEGEMTSPCAAEESTMTNSCLTAKKITKTKASARKQVSASKKLTSSLLKQITIDFNTGISGGGPLRKSVEKTRLARQQQSTSSRKKVNGKKLSRQSCLESSSSTRRLFQQHQQLMDAYAYQRGKQLQSNASSTDFVVDTMSSPGDAALRMLGCGEGGD